MSISQMFSKFFGRSEQPAVSVLDEARSQNRYQDGANSTIFSVGGNVYSGVIVDVSSRGLRLRSRAALGVGERIKCRVTFRDRSEYLSVRVVWEALAGDGFEFEYGVRYEPVVPGTLNLLDNYLQKVLQAA
jgi:hypothetical protein